MKRSDPYKPVWFIAFVVAGLVAVTGISGLLAAKEVVPWRTDFDAALKEAAAGGKPVLTYFTADWCGPCHTLKRTTWADADVERALRAYVPVKVDIDRHPDLAISYRADAIPKVAILDPSDGRVVRSAEGAMPPGEFLAWLNAGAGAGDGGATAPGNGRAAPGPSVSGG